MNWTEHLSYMAAMALGVVLYSWLLTAHLPKWLVDLLPKKRATKPTDTEGTTGKE